MEGIRSSRREATVRSLFCIFQSQREQIPHHQFAAIRSRIVCYLILERSSSVLHIKIQRLRRLLINSFVAAGAKSIRRSSVGFQPLKNLLQQNAPQALRSGIGKQGKAKKTRCCNGTYKGVQYYATGWLKTGAVSTTESHYPPDQNIATEYAAVDRLLPNSGCTELCNYMQIVI